MTTFPTAMDDARIVTADTSYDVALLQGLDAQIQALGKEIVEQRNRPFVPDYPKADPDQAAIPAGRAVAMRAAIGPNSEPLMVLATAANVAAGAIVHGVLTEATAPGVRGRVAVSGFLPPSVTGLSSGGNVRANAATGALEVVAGSFGTGDIKIGRASSSGLLVVDPGVTVDGGLTIYPSATPSAARSAPFGAAFLRTLSADPNQLVYTHTPPVSSVALIESRLVGMRGFDEDVHIAQQVTACFRVSSGGTITQMGTTDIPNTAPGFFSQGTTFGFAPSIVISGSNLLFRVTPPSDDEAYDWLWTWRIVQMNKT